MEDKVVAVAAAGTFLVTLIKLIIEWPRKGKGKRRKR